jgi:UDP-GlcNAc:undecaprenyl-phosphate/decaprenyl-phosphate GlcNAc-1-phosphate transferase
MWAALVAGTTVVVSLYTGPLMWTMIGVATGLTVALTFVLPVVHRPQLAAHDEA